MEPKFADIPDILMSKAGKLVDTPEDLAVIRKIIEEAVAFTEQKLQETDRQYHYTVGAESKKRGRLLSE